MKTKDFFYDLPEQLIAQTPVEPRDSSRLMIYDRHSKTVYHEVFNQLPKYLKKGDVLVINDTKVIPARIHGTKKGTGGKVEFLLLKRIDYTKWEVLLKPGRIARPGAVFEFGENLSAKVLEIVQDGARIVEFSFNGIFEDVLAQIGEMPLPPYIKEKLNDQNRYNTIYSKDGCSAAAPTAGLHFTKSLMDEIEKKGVQIERVMLNVGLGTFRPVKVDDVTQHKMHSEYFSIDEKTAQNINQAKREGRRIFAIGTTSVRVLESASDENGILTATSGNTEIFIYPPYKFKIVDCLLTNFHLPESTLLMLVSAFCSKDEVMTLYETAVKEKYRFFSFGDATLFI